MPERRRTGTIRPIDALRTQESIVQPVISISNLCKTYATGFEALKRVNLDVRKGEILALLGPNGAGKTTLINIVCGIVQPTSGTVIVDGEDVIKRPRSVRGKIGLVPQELTTDAFESVQATATFSRGLFGKPKNPAHIEATLRSLALWEKRNSRIMTLSGGMKRRVLIAKALAHEPEILFLDEPTAGVDVELRQGMWEVVRGLQRAGVTIILTTHYIDEAEEMAERIAVINNGEIMLVQEKNALMTQLGQKQLILNLTEPLLHVPESLARHEFALSEDKLTLTYTYDTQRERTGITQLLAELSDNDIRFKDLATKQSSLEEIFVNLVKRPK